MNFALKIFIIEDSSSMREAIYRQLSKEYGKNVDIYQYESIESVISISDLVPDVIFLDHYLKKSEGISSIPKLLEMFPKVDIAVISGQDDMDVFKEAYANGAKEYIRKNALLFHSITDFLKPRLVAAS